MPAKSSSSLSRRSFLELGSTSALLSFAACATRGPGCRSSASTGIASGTAVTTTSEVAPATTPADLTALAARFTKTPRDKVLEEATSALRAGATYETLLGAAFLAGIREIDAGSPGGKLHAVMGVSSAFQLADQAPKTVALRLALWMVDAFKKSQQRDIDEGDWHLSPPPEATFPNAETASRELTSAMDAWDTERAERAVSSLKSHSDHRAVFEALWPYACRSFTGAGHKMIHAAQVERTLLRIGWAYSEPVLRALVQTLLANRHGDKGIAAYEAAEARTGKLQAGWLDGKSVPERSAELMRAMRTTTIESAQDLVIDAFKDGLSPGTVWDGLHLFGAELFLGRASSRPATAGRSLFPVHGTTVCEALNHAFYTTTNESTKRLLVLQAAGWLSAFRDTFVERIGLRRDGPKLDELTANEDITTAEQLLQTPTPEGALGLLSRHPDEAPALRQALTVELAHKGEEVHQHKYTAAMLTVSGRADPRWRAHLLAPALPYVPVLSDPVTDVGERIDAALKDAGML